MSRMRRLAQERESQKETLAFMGAGADEVLSRGDGIGTVRDGEDETLPIALGETRADEKTVADTEDMSGTDAEMPESPEQALSDTENAGDTRNTAGPQNAPGEEAGGCFGSVTEVPEKASSGPAGEYVPAPAGGENPPSVKEEATQILDGVLGRKQGRILSRFCGMAEKWPRVFSRPGLMAFMAFLLFAVMAATMADYVIKRRDAAETLLREGPAEAYRLTSEGLNDEARRLWMQINAQNKWYMPFAGIFTSIDEPYLQKASLAFMAEAWDDVAENAYRALNVPVTDQQAKYLQQMILVATAKKVRAYLPGQGDQPIKGGTPEHAAPVCDPASAWVWVTPCVLVLLAAVCLYGRMRFLFTTTAFAMVFYFWCVSTWNSAAVRACEARLSFNPSHIELYDIPARTAQASAGLTIVNGHPFDPLVLTPRGAAADIPEMAFAAPGATPPHLSQTPSPETQAPAASGK